MTAKLFENLQRNRLCLQTDAKQRIAKLNRLKRWIYDNRQAIRDAMAADSGKPELETDLWESHVVIADIRNAVRHLRRWMKPHSVRRSLILATTRSKITYQPKGVVLILAPWNFPFMLSLGPLVSAIAAGNCVILKPSELASNTSKLLVRMAEELFPNNEVAVVEGDQSVGKELLELPFDHIFFTGSTEVGKKVMRAASQHLTSVTLELGGKSPCIVDETANIPDAALKIVWGKFANSGQTCIAPDYILVHDSVAESLMGEMLNCINRVYGDSFEERMNSSYSSRIIDNRHFDRLLGLLAISVHKGAVIQSGGESDRNARYIEPTLVTNTPDDAPLMAEEIFGPILPIIRYTDIKQAVVRVNTMPKPLALYHFSRKRKNIRHILSQIPAGGVCVNDVVLQFIHPNLPFGGIANSGIGSAHGFFGFKAFSHERAVLRHSRISLLKLVFPPYNKFKKFVIEIVYRYL